MDIFDDADKTSELFLKIATDKREPKRIHRGFCESCFSPLKKGEQFCDADCRDDFQLAEKQKKIQGK